MRSSASTAVPGISDPLVIANVRDRSATQTGAGTNWRTSRGARLSVERHAGQPCITGLETGERSFGASTVMLGAQQREGARDALVKDLIGEFSVGQGAGELQCPGHQGEEAERLEACGRWIIGCQAGGDIVAQCQDAVSVGAPGGVRAAADPASLVPPARRLDEPPARRLFVLFPVPDHIHPRRWEERSVLPRYCMMIVM